MKYFSIDSVIKAYQQISSTSKEKFWGLLGIVYSIDKVVGPNTYLNINTFRLSSFLEDTFRLRNKKNYSNIKSEYSVVFSQFWYKYVAESFLVGRPSITPFLVWSYRKCGFDHDMNSQELLQKFLNDFHLTKEVVEELFHIDFNACPIEYCDYQYSDDALFSSLGGFSSGDTIKLKNNFALANAGDLSRGSFFQPFTHHWTHCDV